ncbi:hypothetical protein ABZV76_23170 [Streptomyces tendae]|uniref:hypothetical protein n=1 Tax=Streptomyces tendae TaxID=1932 RepID=UPI0033A57CFB
MTAGIGAAIGAAGLIGSQPPRPPPNAGRGSRRSNWARSPSPVSSSSAAPWA